MSAFYLSQIRMNDSRIAVVLREGNDAHILADVGSTLELAHRAIAAQRSLHDEAARTERMASVDLELVEREGRFLLPVTHPDPARCLLSGTGLTHLYTESFLSEQLQQCEADSPSASSKLYRMGLEGGRPAPGRIGVQPQWFYKGNGHITRPSGNSIDMPSFARDAGAQVVIAAIYLISADGAPFRLGFSLANDCTDHMMEQSNALWLAHAKMRQASYGPELRLGNLPTTITGEWSLLRDGVVLWRSPFVSGEDHMTHSIANLEHHHFKYEQFRQPGDLHVHFLGTSAVHLGDAVRARDGDIWQICSESFGYPLVNHLVEQPLATEPVLVRVL